MSAATSGVVRPDADADSGPRLRIENTNPVFIDAVMTDLNVIRRTRAGRALFRRLHEAERAVTIVRPDAPTDPPNAWTIPQSGPGSGAIIAYDPADWPSTAYAGSPSSDAVLFGQLERALPLRGESVGQSSGPLPGMAEYLRELRDARARRNLPDE